jgi:hypothetical protein
MVQAPIQVLWEFSIDYSVPHMTEHYWPTVTYVKPQRQRWRTQKEYRKLHENTEAIKNGWGHTVGKRR